MSHSDGAVKFLDGTIMFFEYNGTVDVCIPVLYDTYDEMRANWRRTDLKNSDYYCKAEIGTLSHSWEWVRIATSYGGGFSWDGKVCRQCKRIVNNLEPDYDSQEEGLPDWLPK